MEDLAIFILRVSIGMIMLAHAVYKIRRKAFFDKKWKEEYGYPKGSVLLNIVVQLVGAIALFLGIYSRYISIVLTINMLFAWYICIFNHREPFLSSPDGKGWDINLLLVATLVALILLGDGSWSILELFA
jgi:putative oxidoreductase